MLMLPSQPISSQNIEQLLAPKPREIIPRKKNLSSDSGFYRNEKVETVLLLKHAKSQAKINTLRLKKQENEVKDLRPVPKISKISKQIIEIKEGKGDSTLFGYANTIVSGTKSSCGFIMHPKHSFLSLADLDNEENKDMSNQTSFFHTKKSSQGTFSKESILNLIKNKNLTTRYRDNCTESSNFNENANLQTTYLSENNQTSNQKTRTLIKKHSELTISRMDSSKSQPDLATKNNNALEEIDRIRKALFFRQQEQEVEEKKDILSMTVQQRNEYWLNKKKEKILKEQEKKKEKEVDKCTFTPQLVSRIDISRDIRKSKPTTFYSMKYSEQMNSTSNINKGNMKMNFSKDKTPKPLYKALSPHRQNYMKGPSAEVLKKSTPLGRYRG